MGTRIVVPHRRNAILRRIATYAQPMVVEVGVATGQLSHMLLRGHAGVRVIMVDNWLPTEQQPDQYIETLDCHSRLGKAQQEMGKQRALRIARTFAHRARVMDMASQQAAAECADQSCDMVFLDADHSVPGVTADLHAWWPKVRVGGWIGGHDYGGHALLNGVRRDFGVKEAVDRFFAEHLIATDEDHTWFVQKLQ